MEENFRNILTDGGEILLDSLIENELLREIPVIGTSINMIRAVRSIRDTAYLNKIKIFVEKIGEIKPEQRVKLIAESKKDKKRRAKFGESLFTTLEQSESTTKVEYLAVAFESFLNSEITDEELRLICFGINNSFIDDLIKIVESEKVPPQIILKHNVSSGLAIAVHKNLTFDMVDMEPNYEISNAGVKLRQSWKKYKS